MSLPPPRRTVAGDLVPWVADWARGRAEIEQLRARGMDLDYAADTETAALGASLADDDETAAVASWQRVRAWYASDAYRQQRARELSLVRRHNLALLARDPLYEGLDLDQKLAHGQPILHLDPEPERQQEPLEPDLQQWMDRQRRQWEQAIEEQRALEGLSLEQMIEQIKERNRRTRARFRNPDKTDAQASPWITPDKSGISDSQPEADGQGSTASRAGGNSDDRIMTIEEP
jgi:hypothetical protein